MARPPLDRNKLLSEFRRIYGTRYDYSSVDRQVGYAHKITVTCPVHGSWSTYISVHLKGVGCMECARTEDNLARIAQATKLHRGKYTYDSVLLTSNVRSQVRITCPNHGQFKQTLSSHLKGHGCPECNPTRRRTTKAFIAMAKEVHGDTYSYTKTRYVNSQSPVIVSCQVHGDWTTTPNNHLKGKGCSKCGDERSSKVQRKTVDSFVREANSVHGGAYRYDRVVYTTARQHVLITCPTHGDFSQSPGSHLAGHGCPLCARLRLGTVQEFRLYDRVFTIDSNAEAQALVYLVDEKGIDEMELVVRGDVGYFTVNYNLPTDKKTRRKRKYYPDFFIPSLNRIIEVKSVATLGLIDAKCYGTPDSLFHMTVAKARACVALGYNFTLVIFNDQGARVHLPVNWYEYSLKELINWYF